LIKSQISPSTALAAGIKSISDSQKGVFAATQAAWRFLNNDRVKISDLNFPIQSFAMQETSTSDDYFLMVHDWSRINYNQHSHKKDIKQMTHKTDLGYELTSSLLVDSHSGLPIAAAYQSLSDAKGRWTSISEDQQQNLPHLDDLTQLMPKLDAQYRNLVHVIDREADSVAHLRTWQQQDSKWLVRARDSRLVLHNNQEVNLKNIPSELSYRALKNIAYKGSQAVLEVAETQIILHRSAKPKKQDLTLNKRHKPIEGEPLPVRLVVARLIDSKGNVLTQWLLFTNVSNVKADTIAQWYYYRWNIESYFKLLKSAGQQMESWLQQTSKAIFKRLLITSMACILAWRLQKDESKNAEEAKDLLVGLSGRQQKRNKPVSATALLAGLYFLLSMLETLENYTIEELKQHAKTALAGLQRLV
jgi:transposase